MKFFELKKDGWGMKKIARLFMALGLAAPLVAAAANITSDKWTLVHTNPKGVKFFIIEESVFTRGDLRLVNIQVEHPQPVSHSPLMGTDRNPKMVKSFMYTTWLDCKNNKMKFVAFIAYDASDLRVDSYRIDNDKAQLKTVHPESLAYPVMAPACALVIPLSRQNN